MNESQEDCNQKKLIEKIALENSVFYQVQRQAELSMVTEPYELSPQVVGGIGRTGCREALRGLGTFDFLT